MTNVEEIKSKLDIVELIQEFVPLKQSGVNFKGSCPFHNEKTPSFMVSREKQFFKCFGCLAGGDIFTFLQKIENIEFPEALKILADKAGVELKHQSYNPQFQNLKTRLYELHEVVTKFYQDQLVNSLAGKSARVYLINSRKLSPEIIAEFKIGYAPDSWDATGKFLKTKGFSDNEILQSGLAVEKNNYNNATNYYDRFRDRVMFPISDHHGNIVGFSGRAIKADDQAKYINTSQTIIYNKSQILYGLDKAKKSIRELDFIILVEGQMDVVASHKADVKNIIASSGTALTEDQIRILQRYTNNLVMCFDQDAAGVSAGERGIEMAWRAGMSVKVIILPDNIKDPDELVQKSFPKGTWKEAVNKKVNFMDYFFTVNLKGQNLSDIDVKRKIGARLLTWIAKLGDAIEKDYYLKKLATVLSVDENALRESLGKIGNKIVGTGFKPVQNSDVGTDIRPVQNKSKILSQRLLALALYNSEYAEELISKILPELIDKDYQEFYKILIVHYNKDGNLDDLRTKLQIQAKDLVLSFDTLKLLADNEFMGMSRREINRDFDLSVNFLKHENITTRLKQVENLISQAEQQGNHEKIEKLMKEFTNLSQELAFF